MKWAFFVQIILVFFLDFRQDSIYNYTIILKKRELYHDRDEVASMAQKENQRIALTKKLLQEGLLRLLDIKPLENISVTELCRESGINRATFYNHYSSPQELLDDIEARMTVQLKDIIGNPKTAHEIIAHLENVCAFFLDHAQTVLTLHRCHADDEITDALHELNQNFRLYTLSSKYTESMSKESLHLVSVFFYTGCYNILLEWIRRDLPLTPKEIANLMLRLASENFLE